MPRKKLDFAVLAGCSCLITLLHHPVAEALSPLSLSQTVGQNYAAVMVEVRSSQTNPRSLEAMLGEGPSDADQHP